MRVWVLVRGEGSYTEREEKPVRVYLDEQRAKEILSKLEAIHRTVNRPSVLLTQEGTNHFQWLRDNPGVCDAAAVSYAELGFEGNYDCDWNLFECEVTP